MVPLSTCVLMMVYLLLPKFLGFFFLFWAYDIDVSYVGWWCIGLYHLTGLVHVSEVSWDYVQDVRDVLRDGDEVRVIVTNIDKWVAYFGYWNLLAMTHDIVFNQKLFQCREKSRITLSIKQLEDDPLLETLDKVILKVKQCEWMCFLSLVGLSDF
jgi:predicted RNA-binding protein with RPS1 domain